MSNKIYEYNRILEISLYDINMYDMTEIENHYDKTYVLFIIESLGITAYQLSKQTGISNKTFTNIKNFKANLSWNIIRQIEKISPYKFKSQEHIAYSQDFYRDNPDLFK